MARIKFNWRFDEANQVLHAPSGLSIAVADIAAMLQDRLTCTHDFEGEWTGWRMRGSRLIPPGASYRSGGIAPHQLRAFGRWLRANDETPAQTGVEGFTPPAAPLTSVPMQGEALLRQAGADGLIPQPRTRPPLYLVK